MTSPLERARSGDADALAAVLTELAPSLHRFTRRMCRHDADADDALQDALLAVATHLPEFEGRASLSSWAFTLARTACSRRRRGMKNQPPVEDVPDDARRDTAPSPEDHAAERELADVLTTALDALADEHREVIQLRDIEGLTAPEAAAALGLSVDALKSRLHRARGALRDRLRPRLEGSAPPPSPSCPDIAATWSRKLEGDLRPEDCAAMERHMEGCASCGAACDALKRALGACQRATTAVVDPAVQARVRAAMAAWAAGQVRGPASPRR